jgi:hypothetical protein
MNDSCAESARRAPIAVFHESRTNPFFSRTKPERVLRGLSFLNRQFQISVLCHSEERSDEESAPAGETKKLEQILRCAQDDKTEESGGIPTGSSAIHCDELVTLAKSGIPTGSVFQNGIITNEVAALPPAPVVGLGSQKAKKESRPDVVR